MKARHLLLALPIFLGACAPPEPELIGTIDPNLTPQCIEAVHEADAWWAEQLGLEHVFKLRIAETTEKPGPYEVTFTSHDFEKPLGDAARKIDSHGHLYNGRVRFDEGNCTMYVAAHEIGHILGLWHQENRSSLMYPYAAGGMELLDYELEVAAESLKPIEP